MEVIGEMSTFVHPTSAHPAEPQHASNHQAPPWFQPYYQLRLPLVPPERRRRYSSRANKSSSLITSHSAPFRRSEKKAMGRVQGATPSPFHPFLILDSTASPLWRAGMLPLRGSIEPRHTSHPGGGRPRARFPEWVVLKTRRRLGVTFLAFGPVVMITGHRWVI